MKWEYVIILLYKLYLSHIPSLGNAFCFRFQFKFWCIYLVVGGSLYTTCFLIFLSDCSSSILLTAIFISNIYFVHTIVVYYMHKLIFSVKRTNSWKEDWRKIFNFNLRTKQLRYGRIFTKENAKFSILNNI